MRTQPETLGRLRFVPGINDFKTAVDEVGNIARGKLRSSHARDGCDLCLCVTNRFAEGATLGSDPGINARSFTVETQDAAG